MLNREGGAQNAKTRVPAGTRVKVARYRLRLDPAFGKPISFEIGAHIFIVGAFAFEFGSPEAFGVFAAFSQARNGEGEKRHGFVSCARRTWPARLA